MPKNNSSNVFSKSRLFVSPCMEEKGDEKEGERGREQLPASPCTFRPLFFLSFTGSRYLRRKRFLIQPRIRPTPLRAPMDIYEGTQAWKFETRHWKLISNVGREREFCYETEGGARRCWKRHFFSGGRMLDLASFFGNRVLKMAKLGSLRRATRPSIE